MAQLFYRRLPNWPWSIFGGLFIGHWRILWGIPQASLFPHCLLKTLE
jgi:hypothetical protein